MRTTYKQASFLNRITTNHRNSQVVSMENHREIDLELFHKHVADRFYHLDARAHDHAPLLSISWFQKLLDVLLICEAEFKAVVINGRDPSQFSKPPLDRLVHDLLDRSVKSLDVCNAVTRGIEIVRYWQKLAQIAVTALEQKPLGDGTLRRAKKALNALLASLAVEDNKESNSNSHAKFSDRTRSFGRYGRTGKENSGDSFRSMTWSVAKPWSAAKQIQAMSANLVAPRGLEPTAFPVYVMSTVLVFVMWAWWRQFHARIGLGFRPIYQHPDNWAGPNPLLGFEEWKKKEKKGTCGLLEEVQRMEKTAQSLLKFTGSHQFPFEEETAEEVAAQAAEMGDICREMEEGLLPLQQQVREVFHRIVRIRSEIVDVLDRVGK